MSTMRIKSALMTGSAWPASMVVRDGGEPTAADIKKLAEDLKSVGGELKKSHDDVKKTAEQALAEAKSLGDISKATKEEFDKKFSEYNGLVARVTDIEKKMSRASDQPEPAERKGLGKLVTESDAWKKAGVNSSFRGQVAVKIDAKDITSRPTTVGATTSPGTSLVPAHHVPTIITPRERTLRVRDLLAQGTTNSNAIEYAQETGFTNLAKVVSEGVKKPQSDLTFNLKIANVRTIAHYFKASRQILDDSPALESYIEARAGYGIRFAEESELLMGDGTGQHLLGLVPGGTPYNPAFAPSAPQQIDRVRLAMLQVSLAEFPSTGIVMHPTDWAKIQLLKDSMNRYIVGDPINNNEPRLWNVPVVETPSIPIDTFLTGAFNVAAQIFDKLGLEILLSTENEDDFTKNMVTIRAEERLALAIYRPEAFVVGDFGLVS